MHAVCVRWVSISVCGLMCSLVGRFVLKCVAVFVYLCCVCVCVCVGVYVLLSCFVFVVSYYVC